MGTHAQNETAACNLQYQDFWGNHTAAYAGIVASYRKVCLVLYQYLGYVMHLVL